MRCARCGAPLRSPASRRRGLGRQCAQALGDSFQRPLPLQQPLPLVAVGGATRERVVGSREDIAQGTEALAAHILRAERLHPWTHDHDQYDAIISECRELWAELKHRSRSNDQRIAEEALDVATCAIRLYIAAVDRIKNRENDK